MDKERKRKEREQKKQYLSNNEWYAAALYKMTDHELKKWRNKLRVASREEEERLFKQLRALMTEFKKRSYVFMMRKLWSGLFKCTRCDEPYFYKSELEYHQTICTTPAVCKRCNEEVPNIIYSVVR